MLYLICGVLFGLVFGSVFLLCVVVGVKGQRAVFVPPVRDYNDRL